MRQVINKILFMVMLTISISGCDDFLTEVNPNAISTDNFWKNLRDCESGMIAVYNQLRNPSIVELVPESLRADLAWPGYGRPNATNEFYLQTFTDGSKPGNNKWSELYKGIFRANQVIKGLEGIEDQMNTEEDKAKWVLLMAEARFFRGLFHFYAHSSFNQGQVVIFDFVPQSEKEFYQTVSPSEQVIEFFRKDFEFAHQHLPLTRTGFNGEGVPLDPQMLGRVSKGTVGAILGTSYLYEKDYVNAARYFKEVIDSGVYRLAHVGENSTTKGEFNEESILEISYDLNFKLEETVYSSKGTKSIYAMLISQVGGWRSLIPSCWLIMAYKNDALDPNDSRNLIVYTEIDPETGEEVQKTRLRDYSLRTSYSIALPDDRDLIYYGASPTVIRAQFSNLECAYFRKYSNWDIAQSEADLNNQSGINFRLMRLADVYLMYAEALIKGGTDESGVEEAIRYINRVRNRSALTLLGDTKDINFPQSTIDNINYDAMKLMEHLMYVERPLELALDGYAIRQLDLRRWGITKQRFQELSEITYTVDNFNYIDEQGENKVRYNCVIKEGYNPDYPNINLIDYTQAAANYNEDSHDYFPIPNIEKASNPNIFNPK
ncbi:RagB/SusD family nutrient uptake outer membrane protein [Persicobacter psychrovividus]|uniref:RagB/SusD family nutrient uptake outer membrane protein n=1 Tax=Persicobacter psychrovividus TaxID=387638 RepID=A0ABM7VMP8_9BACT|nr:hypothetical protein PEPS_45710 [Persicobacter psychrovividus]